MGKKKRKVISNAYFCKKYIQKQKYKDIEITEIKNGISNLVEKFEEKLLYDSHKEGQIDKLHSEVQEYKMNLLAKTNRPFIIGLIYMFDDLDKLLEKMNEEEDKKTIKILKNFKEDIEILLEENGISRYTEVSLKFNPLRQQVIKKVPIKDKEKVGEVKKSIRVGFEMDNTIMRKEKVEVYIYNKGDENE